MWRINLGSRQVSPLNYHETIDSVVVTLLRPTLRFTYPIKTLAFSEWKTLVNITCSPYALVPSK